MISKRILYCPVLQAANYTDCRAINVGRLMILFWGKNNFIYKTWAARIIETRKTGTEEDGLFPEKGVLQGAEGQRGQVSSQPCHTRWNAVTRAFTLG